MSPSIKFLFQVFPLYGDVLLLACSVLWSPAWEQRRAPDDLYRLDCALKKHSRGSFRGGYTTSHHETVSLQARDRYEKMLEDVSSYTPRYMEEMEAIFEQSQEEERKRISFLKQAFLSIHRHLDVTNNERWAVTSDTTMYKVQITGLTRAVCCVLLCQCEGGLQWTPQHPDVNQWSRWPQMVETQSRSRHANWLAEDRGMMFFKKT